MLNFLIGLVANLIALLVGDWFTYVLSLALLVPGIALGVRCLHDIGKSGWWMLISFVPLIGAIWLIILFIKEGDRGANAYGEDPKAS